MTAINAPVCSRWLRVRFALLGCALLLGIAATDGAESLMPRAGNLYASFLNPPAVAHTRFFWRILGPSWTSDEIDFQLQLMSEAGAGGVTAFFMYPVELDSHEVHNQQFLSAEFLTNFHHAAEEARRLGLRFSVAGGTGWPFGGPAVSRLESAQQIRRLDLAPSAPNQPLTLPRLSPGEEIVAIFDGTNRVAVPLSAQAEFSRASLSGRTLTIFVAGPTGMQVKRAALGAEGWVVDHYSAVAALHYLDQVVAPMLAAAPGLVNSVFCDSLEVYRANWTADLPEIFQASRHRALLPLLPAVFDQQMAGSPLARFDFWRTLAETTESRFTRTLSQWSHAHGVQLEMEAYGTPPNPLTAARYIDLPTGEQYEWRGFSLSRLASSGAHLAGRRVIGAEAWTWMGLPNRLADSLSDTKLCSDLHYLAGINDLTGVDFAYSPRSAGRPGWMPYYGPVFNQNNPQWLWMKYLIAYTSRCNWLLRQGSPVAQVALYLPVEDKFAYGSTEQMALGFELRDHFVSGPKTDEFGLQTALRHHSDLIDSLFAAGLNFDGIDFFALVREAKTSGGRLRAGDGEYRVLILPRLIGLEAKALKKVVDFCASGGTVIVTGRLPEEVYGLEGLRAKHTAQELYGELFGTHTDVARRWVHSFKSGKVMFVPDEKEGLRQALRAIPADLLLEPAKPEVGFVHRHAGSREIYFLANTSDRFVHATAKIQGNQRSAELWDPLSGERQPAGFKLRGDGILEVPVSLAARGSIFIVTGLPSGPASQPETVWQTEPIAIKWSLSFPDAGGQKVRNLDQLISWTDWPETRFYSGIGRYVGELVWNKRVAGPVLLGLGEVREVAEVSINGLSAGPGWIPPFEVDISPALKAGTNHLEISVANLSLNGFLGTPDQDLAALRARFGNRFPAPEEKSIHPKPAPSGLIGPLYLRYHAE